MNIFRLCADMSHLVAIFLLLLKMLHTKSSAGTFTRACGVFLT